jgi:hypothetical protein
MRFSVFIFILFISVHSSDADAQKISRRLISVAGLSHTSAGNYYLSYSVGESVAVSSTRNSYTLTQGFQQPSLILKETVLKPSLDEVRVYPNPVINDLIIKFDVKDIRNYRIEVSSINGRTMIIKDIDFDESLFWDEKIDFSEFAQGVYLVHVHSKNKRIDKKFSIIKIN